MSFVCVYRFSVAIENVYVEQVLSGFELGSQQVPSLILGVLKIQIVETLKNR